MKVFAGCNPIHGHFAAAAAAAIALAACGSGANGQSAPAPAGGSEETRPANTTYAPAFPGQTRAPRARSEMPYDVQVVARGLDHPWAVNFLPDGRALVTEKPGRLRILAADGKLSAPVAGLPKVDDAKQGGLLDVVSGPDGLIYWSYAEGRPDGDGTAVARGRLVDGPQPRLEAVQVIFQRKADAEVEHALRRSPGVRARRQAVHHPGRALDPARPGAGPAAGQPLRQDRADQSRRLGPRATIPIVGKAGALPEIWSIGQRNVQAAALDADGRLWEVEHGPRGGDELNRVERGKDYGWPTISYGIEYSGPPIGAGITQAPAWSSRSITGTR